MLSSLYQLRDPNNGGVAIRKYSFPLPANESKFNFISTEWTENQLAAAAFSLKLAITGNYLHLVPVGRPLVWSFCGENNGITCELV